MNQNTPSFGRELLVFIVTIALSVLLFPGIIYVVGGQLFGAYDATDSNANIYVATLTDLTHPRLAAWIIVVGPAVCVLLLRLIFRLTQHDAQPDTPTPDKRKEPTVNG